MRHHHVLDKNQEDHYNTIAAQNNVDGKLHTFQFLKEDQSKLLQGSTPM